MRESAKVWRRRSNRAGNSGVDCKSERASRTSLLLGEMRRVAFPPLPVVGSSVRVPVRLSRRWTRGKRSEINPPFFSAVL